MKLSTPIAILISGGFLGIVVLLHPFIAPSPRCKYILGPHGSPSNGAVVDRRTGWVYYGLHSEKTGPRSRRNFYYASRYRYEPKADICRVEHKKEPYSPWMPQE